MMVYDPDVVRWNLHTLIDTTCCPPSQGTIPPSQGSYSTITRFEPGSCPVGLVREGYVDTVENDAVIARALQEEYSRVAASEASGISDPGKETILAQDWAGHSEMRTRGDDSASWSSVEEQPHGFEEPLLDIVDESALDGEVGKRLNQMVPVRHVPKINGSIPSEDEEISDHERLLERLKVYDLVENKVQGDGNCQFRALSDQLYRSPEYHKHVREQVVQQLKSYPEVYGGYVPMAYNIYLKNMSKSGEWGDHVTLQAAADTYGVKIFVLTSFKDTCYIEILPHVQKSNRVIFLSFWAEVHYNSIYPEGELPVKKKKKWWSLGSELLSRF